MKKRHAFTLVELLVVIAIIAVLLGILLPSLTSIKGAAKRLQCAQKLGGIGKALNMYVGQYDNLLPLVEYYNSSVPSIESTYLLTKGSSPRHLGCLIRSGLLDDGKMLFCPAVDGWYGEPGDVGSNNGTFLGAMNQSTLIFADGGPPSQGWKAHKGYCYWPLSKKMAKQTDINNMSGSSPSRYVAGLPLNATKMNELLMARPIVTDNKFHSTKTSGWLIDCLYPDGHVNYQKQPQRDGVNGNGVQGTWGMYSNNENCQFPRDMTTATDPVTIKDTFPAEKALNLARAVTCTEFAYALEP